MKAFCDIDQYGRKYTYDPADTELLNEFLEDATALIKAELRNAGIRINPCDTEYADILMRVCRDMTSRALKAEINSDGIPIGTTQHTLSANGYSEQFGWTGTGGDGYGGLYLKNSEKRALGIGNTYIAAVSPDLKGVNPLALR